MMASGKRKATSNDIVRKSKKIKLNGSDGVTDMYNFYVLFQFECVFY